MNKINYQKELEHLIDKLPDHHRRLFLHSCCAPCSSYCLEYLRQYFDVTVFYYNPNISFLEEYRHRVEELKRLVSTLNEEAKGSEMLNQIALLEGTYEPEKFFEATKGLEDCPEGGERCFICYELRLREAARLAEKGGYLRSIELSRQYDLYRQDYCGCVFSKQERDKRIAQES